MQNFLLVSIALFTALMIGVGCQEQTRTPKANSGAGAGKTPSEQPEWHAGTQPASGESNASGNAAGQSSVNGAAVNGTKSNVIEPFSPPVGGPSETPAVQAPEEGIQDLQDGPALGNPASGGPLSKNAAPRKTPLIRNVAAPKRDPYGEKKAIDPVAVNGRVFEDWPKPKLAIVITGQQNGYLEPCGCAGLENMKGGLMRRHTLLKSLTAKEGYGWPGVIAIDLGNFVRRYGWQANQQYETSADALKIMNYDAIGFGPDDLKLGIDPLLTGAGSNEGRFVAANLALLGWEDSPTVRYRVIQRGGLKIGITAVLGDTYAAAVTDDQIVRKDAKAALKEVLPKLRAENCHVLVLLSHATMEESKQLGKQFPQFDIVVTADGPDEPPFEPEIIEGTGKNWLVETGKKGMYLNVIGLYGNGQTRRLQRVPMDSRFADSPEVRKLMLKLQDTYKQHFLRLGWRGMGIMPQPHHSGRQFVGSETCGECHTKAFAVWQDTPHAHAMDTLINLDVPRQFDAECISCHATGWDPQKYFPYRSGYDSMKKTPHLAHNGCENCHGPGSKHVKIEEGAMQATAAERRAAREEMRVTLAEAKAKTCAACHDLDNSPDYLKEGFDAYWPKVRHQGKD